MAENALNIAVVGGGVAGIVAAHLLQQRHQVTLFEKNAYLGGHTHTIEIASGPDAGLAVDTGFIVFNDRTYPHFETFLDRLGVASRLSEMSFSFCCRQSGLVYAGNNFNGLFAQRRNLLRPGFWRFLREILRFCRTARADLAQGRVPAVDLAAYLRRHRFSAFMTENYLLPMAAAIWSAPPGAVGSFPAEPFLRFFLNHGLLSLRNRPNWKTVAGGSHSYVKAFLAGFKGQLRLNGPIASIVRDNLGVRLHLGAGQEESFDRVVIATHADQALRLLADPDEREERLLGPWRYQKNHTVLHTDSARLPHLGRARSSWNFIRERQDDAHSPVSVTYYMNCLQGLKSRRDYCVTLNHEGDFAPGSVIAEMDYHHPQYSFAAMETQAGLPELNGRRHSYFCGSYFGYGFHEDAVRSAVAVGRHFDVEL